MTKVGKCYSKKFSLFMGRFLQSFLYNLELIILYLCNWVGGIWYSILKVACLKNWRPIFCWQCNGIVFCYWSKNAPNETLNFWFVSFFNFFHIIQLLTFFWIYTWQKKSRMAIQRQNVIIEVIIFKQNHLYFPSIQLNVITTTTDATFILARI